jgi:hypothetical protein
MDTAVLSCCIDEEYKTFSVHANEIPAFLGPLIVSNFSVAFSNHGMQPVEQAGDLVAELRYEQIDLTEDRERDDFDERIATGDAERFIARIAIEIKDTDDGKVVWSGHVQRLHDVGPGEWMHTGVASIAIFEAFTEVLEGYGE